MVVLLLFFIMISLNFTTHATSRMNRLGTRSLSMRLKPPPLKSDEVMKAEASAFKGLKNYVDSSPTPHHCVATTINLLQKAGFKALSEHDLWKQNNLLQKSGKYYYTRDESSIVAFTIGGKYVAGNPFKVIGAHTDSPNLRVKPRSKRNSNGMLQIGVQTYGGGLWSTWFDRDLGIAGRCIIRKKSDSISDHEDSNGDADNDLFETKLVMIDRPILRIPSLCIHLRDGTERDWIKLNKEDHLVPILSAEIEKVLESNIDSDQDDNSDISNSTSSSSSNIETIVPDAWRESQQPELLRVLAEELGCNVDDIADFDLALFDTQGVSYTGTRNEFLVGSRLDNLASCYVAIEALTECATATGAKSLDNDDGVNIIALFDHEEVGSSSNTGAGSPIMRDAVTRISNCFMANEDSEVFKVALSKSMIFSVDMAHAIHPNYASKHEKQHSPQMNKGVVIKSNANQRYATTGVTGFITRELARRASIPIQEFVVRNDCPCGSTIGPKISENTGIRAIDLGLPQLSMHSIREMSGVNDLVTARELFVAFFKDFSKIDESLKLTGK